MKLYHGTNLDIQSINLAMCRPYKDFVKGFYTTEILERAQKMAKRVVRIFGGMPIVNMILYPVRLQMMIWLCFFDNIRII